MVRFSDLLGGDDPEGDRSGPTPARDHLDRLAGIAAGRSLDDAEARDPDPDAVDQEAGEARGAEGHPGSDGLEAAHDQRPGTSAGSASAAPPSEVKRDRSAFARLVRESDVTADDAPGSLGDLPPVDDDLLPGRRHRS